MRVSFLISFLLHATLLGVWYLLPDSWKPQIEIEDIVPVEFLTEAEFAELTSLPPQIEQPIEEVLPEPTDLQPDPEPVEPLPEITLPPEPTPATPITPPEEIEPAPVEEVPEPTPEKQEDPQPPEEPTPEPTPTPTDDKKPEEDLFASLGDTLDDLTPEDDTSRSAPQEAAIGENRPQIGDGLKLSASHRALLLAHMVPCWNTQAFIGAPEPERLQVKILFKLNRDGSLIGQPQVLNKARIRASGNGYWQIAERESLNAVRSCAPYNFLPQNRYDDWKEIEMNFNPAQMAGL
ncbi:MAG: hypothetical protein ACWA5L_04160 [bacterium]